MTSLRWLRLRSRSGKITVSSVTDISILSMRPSYPVGITFYSFRVMVVLGSFFLLLLVAVLVGLYRKKVV